MEDKFFENPDSQSKTPSLSHLGLGEMVFAILEHCDTFEILRGGHYEIAESVHWRKKDRPEPTKTKKSFILSKHVEVPRHGQF